MPEQTSIIQEFPRETTASASSALSVHGGRRISAAEQQRLYEAEMRGEKPLLRNTAGTYGTWNR